MCVSLGCLCKFGQFFSKHFVTDASRHKYKFKISSDLLFYFKRDLSITFMITFIILVIHRNLIHREYDVPFIDSKEGCGDNTFPSRRKHSILRFSQLLLQNSLD